jgi:magnesium chelatase family protein
MMGGRTNGEAEILRVRSAMLRGIEPIPIDVEVSTSHGIPGINIVGMPDAAVLEARSRVRSAIRLSGYVVPRLNIMVNLAPSELRKNGTAFDLPIAVAILCATGQISRAHVDQCLFVGELSLDGEVCDVNGGVAYSQLAAEEGRTLVAARPIGVEGLRCATITRLADLKRGIMALPEGPSQGIASVEDGRSSFDFGDVCDQEVAKRACVIAATGRHGLLMVGPPGAGKTMLARSMPSILPPLDEEERLQSMLIHSVAGLSIDGVAAGIRPFRAPHHTISAAGLVGGGRPVRPGEISLAHNGVLFLDELPEFDARSLDALRQPMEDGEVRLVRVDGVYRFPSRFMLVAAANPCPCGHLGDDVMPCTCSEAAIRKYRTKLCGPLADRIDLQLDVRRPDPGRLVAHGSDTDSHEMAEQVEAARTFAAWRRRSMRCQSADGAIASLGFQRPALASLEELSRTLGFGGRGTTRVASVARTIADLAEHELITVDDVAEASFFRAGAHS